MSNLPGVRARAKALRDQRAERIRRKLQEDEFFANIPSAVIGNYADLWAVAAQLKQKLMARGYERDGKIDAPAIDAWRRVLDSARNYLALMIAMNGGDASANAGGAVDVDAIKRVEEIHAQRYGQGRE